MKTSFILSAAVALATFCGAAIPEPPHVGKRAPKIFKTGKKALTLTAGNAAIVIDPQAPPVLRFAAKELAAFLNRSLKGKVNIFTAPQKGKINIFLGFNRWSAAAGIENARHHKDSYTILINSKGVFIAGQDDPKALPEKVLGRGIWAHLYQRSTLFGVYEFLERFAGVRFYFEGLGTIVPAKKAIVLPETEIFDYPDFVTRRVSLYHGVWPGKKVNDGKWYNRNISGYRYRMETSYVPCCHGLSRTGFLKRFGESNPEYFALMTNGKRHNNPSLPHPGSLCYSSGIREEIYQDVKSYLLGEVASKRKVMQGKRYAWDPNVFQPGFADVMPQDSYYRCNCKKCASKFTSSENYASDFMWGLTAEIASRLQKEKVPGFVTMMAYFPYRDVPKFKLPSNILVMVAERGPWGIYNPAQQKKDLAEIISWAKKINKKVWLWNYLCKQGKTGFPGVPSPSAYSLQPYFKEVAPYITGAFLESETDRFINNYLTYYLYGKFCWNNKADLEAMIREHHQLMFGKAANIMGELFTSFEKIWLKEVVGRQVDTLLGPAVIPPSDYDLWHKIYNSSRIAQIKAAFDKAEKLVRNDKDSLARVKLFRNEWLVPLLEARAQYMDRTDAAGKFSMSGARPAYLRIYPNKQTITQKPVQTVVRFKEDAKNFHFTFECEEPLYEHAVSAKREGDSLHIWQDSGVELFLNPSGDRKVYYQFILNLQNALMDQKCTLHGARSTGDVKWNSNAVTSVKRTAKGYKAEISIPKSAFPGYKKSGFPVNFARNRVLSQGVGHAVLYTWSPFVRGFHDLENFGTLKLGKELREENLFSNGDFSIPARNHNIGGWLPGAKLRPGRSWAQDREIFFTAPPSLRLSYQGKENWGGMMVTQFLPKLKPNTKYRLTAYIRFKDVRPLGQGGGVGFVVYDSGNRWFPRHKVTGSSDRWVRQSFEFTTAADTGIKKNDKGQTIKSYFRPMLFRATGTVWFDDLTLEEIKK